MKMGDGEGKKDDQGREIKGPIGDDKVTKWENWMVNQILVRRVTERDDAQKRILKCLEMSGIDRLNQSKYL